MSEPNDEVKSKEIIIDPEEIEKQDPIAEEDSLKVNKTNNSIQNFIALSRNKRWILFTICFSLNILMNIDHGTVPAATDQIRRDLDITDEILGIFGSLVFAGSILGSLISLSLINQFNRKYLLIFSLIICAVILWCFTLKQEIWLLFANRVVVGTFQAFISIYLPVWCDQFGIEDKRTMMIALVQVAPPLGVVLGYFITTMFINNLGWKMSFIVQAISICVLSLILFAFPNKYFSSTFRRTSNSSPPTERRKNSVFYDQKTDSSTTESEVENDPKNNFCNKLLHIFTQPVFIFSVLAMASLYFVLTDIQYWGSDYMESVLGVADQNKRLLSFAIVCLTSPTLGVIFGGMIISKIGGYETKHSISICLLFSFCSFLFTIPVPLVKTLLWFTILLWMVLFFGGAIVAPLAGIIITSLPKDYAGSANSFTIFFCNLLGYLPAPYVYGTLKDHFSGKIAMMCSMWYSISGVLFLMLAAIFRYRNYELIRSYQTIVIEPNEDRNREYQIIEENSQNKSQIPAEDDIVNVQENEEGKEQNNDMIDSNNKQSDIIDNVDIEKEKEQKESKNMNEEEKDNKIEDEGKEPLL